MADWFRNTDWNDDIAADFDRRLSRARGKAQYLNIQAHTLLATHPDVAAGLCRRAIALDDPPQTARAGLYLGTALALTGDTDAAIAALESAIEAERRNPSFRTAAYLDQALLIAVAGRSDLYDLALERLATERSLPFAGQHLSALVAHLLILGDRGEDVAEGATVALQALAGPDGGDALPACLSLSSLTSRLKSLAQRR